MTPEQLIVLIHTLSDSAEEMEKTLWLSLSLTASPVWTLMHVKQPPPHQPSAASSWKGLWSSAFCSVCSHTNLLRLPCRISGSDLSSVCAFTGGGNVWGLFRGLTLWLSTAGLKPEQHSTEEQRWSSWNSLTIKMSTVIVWWKVFFFFFN